MTVTLFNNLFPGLANVQNIGAMQVWLGGQTPENVEALCGLILLGDSVALPGALPARLQASLAATSSAEIPTLLPNIGDAFTYVPQEEWERLDDSLRTNLRELRFQDRQTASTALRDHYWMVWAATQLEQATPDYKKIGDVLDTHVTGQNDFAFAYSRASIAMYICKAMLVEAEEEVRLPSTLQRVDDALSFVESQIPPKIFLELNIWKMSLLQQLKRGEETAALAKVVAAHPYSRQIPIYLQLAADVMVLNHLQGTECTASDFVIEHCTAFHFIPYLFQAYDRWRERFAPLVFYAQLWCLLILRAMFATNYPLNREAGKFIVPNENMGEMNVSLQWVKPKLDVMLRDLGEWDCSTPEMLQRYADLMELVDRHLHILFPPEQRVLAEQIEKVIESLPESPTLDRIMTVYRQLDT